MSTLTDDQVREIVERLRAQTVEEQARKRVLRGPRQPKQLQVKVPDALIRLAKEMGLSYFDAPKESASG